jgi:hypothetical protein
LKNSAQILKFVDSQILVMAMPIKQLELVQYILVDIFTVLSSIQEVV